MPTILRVGPYRFFFYAGDRDEPIHVHVEREDNIAKFWIEPVRLQRSGGFRRPEIIRIAKIIEENRTEIVEAWHEYFGS
jgi:hypothetical protein